MSYNKIVLGLTLFIAAYFILPSSILLANEKPRGQITGGVEHSAPDWFKESFLEIQDDVDEATENSRHVLLFFQLNGCPYCDRMLHESFESDPYMSEIQNHFDVIAINVKGDREIAFNEDTSVTEKELSEILNVRATPAIMFLNSENKPVTRVNGYRAPENFHKVLNYVSSKSYENETLANYIDKKSQKDVYTLRDNQYFQNLNDLSSIKGPLAIIFEDKGCYDCDEFHDKILSKDIVQEELKAFTVVRLDTDSKVKIIDTDGNETTAKALANKHEMLYRPGILFFDEGNLIRRNDSLLFSHHFKEGMRFISKGLYKKEDYRAYSERRTEELLAAGVIIDLGSN